MFNLRDFVMKTILNMIGNVPNYKVMEYALSWLNRSTLIDEDMCLIEKKLSELEIKYPKSKNLYGFDGNRIETINGVTCTYNKDTGIFTFNGNMKRKESTKFMLLDNVLSAEPNVTYQLHAYYVDGSISGEFPQYNGGFWIVPRGSRKEGSDFAYGMILDKFSADNPMKIEKFTTDAELDGSSMDFSLSDDCLLEFNNFQVKIMLEVADEPTDYEAYCAE